MKYKYNDYKFIELLQELTKPVQHYYTDYTEYDFPTIMDSMFSKKDYSYLWIIRENGTFLLKLPDEKDYNDNKHFIEYYNAIKLNYPARIEYHIRIENGYFEIINKEIYG